jgi:hypothetical protein
MPENYYDKASRYAANIDAPGFLGWLLGLPTGPIHSRRCEPRDRW